MKIPAKIVIAASSLGMLNALYLTYRFLQEKSGQSDPGFCDINATLSCSSVLSSPYAQFLGVPVCTIALLVYPVLIALGWLALRRQNTRDLFYAISIISALGLMLNLVYIYNEAVYIGSLCALCIFCTFLILSDFAASIAGYARSEG